MMIAVGGGEVVDSSEFEKDVIFLEKKKIAVGNNKNKKIPHIAAFCRDA